MITSIWLYYAALQIILLLALRFNMFAPASVEVIMNEIAGIINLSKLDLKRAMSYIGHESIQQSSVF